MALKEKTIDGMIWSSIGNIGAIVIQFLTNIVLARLISPDDFGCIAMLYIFISISNTFISSGLGSALVQSKEVKRIDYTTVFYYNLAVALLFVIILFLAAPAISRFYDIPLLTKVLRIQSLNLIILSFSMVPFIEMQRELRFKALNLRNLVAAISGAIVAIFMALKGYGVWSLVANGLVTGVVDVCLLWGLSNWKPTWEFSWDSFKRLFSFGGLLLISTLFETIYSNIQGLLIGRIYNKTTLGYYTQARKLEEVPSTTISKIVENVSFPVVAKIQDDKERVRFALQRQYQAVTFLNFPFIILLMVIARPIILLIFGAKWEPSVPYFQILCLSALIYNISTLSTSTVKALGKAKAYLIMQISKRTIGLILVILGAQISVEGLMYGFVASSYISLLINMIVIRHFVNYRLCDYFLHLGPTLLTSLLAALPVALFVFNGTGLHELIYRTISLPNWVTVAGASILYTFLYLGCSKLFRINAFTLYSDILKSKLSRHKVNA